MKLAIGESKNAIDVNVFCYGVKNRCRLANSHMFKLGTFEPNEVNETELIQKAIEVIKQNIKSDLRKPVLSLQPLVIKNAGMFTSRSFQMFTDKKIDLLPLLN